jgi:hypothetical protein
MQWSQGRAKAGAIQHAFDRSKLFAQECTERRRRLERMTEDFFGRFEEQLYKDLGLFWRLDLVHVALHTSPIKMGGRAGARCGWRWDTRSAYHHQ